ncbi:presenilin family intramembrane aspartyl protease PSH [Halovivax sp.]|uniref:presenilin family intramembrane aspartyl protease PSH n=1 Tax=Halovivax sp. TaxID=1935978 RepID=UPI0025C0571F|nr:presenilin family intramembrane aspartyl protease PSH [Halovivax sp.]
MRYRYGVLAAAAGVVALFLGVQLGALLLVEPLQESRGPAVEDPQDPTNSVVFFGVIVVATAVMLAAFKYDADRLIKGLIVAVSVMLSWFVFVELLPPVVTVEGVDVLALTAALLVGAGLLAYPEWYVIDGAGVLMGAGAAALFGISFGLLPAILFLLVLAVYDAISVYKTEHMLSLADGALDLKIPVVFVVPTTLSYSYLETADPFEESRGGGTDGGAAAGTATRNESGLADARSNEPAPNGGQASVDEGGRDMDQRPTDERTADERTVDERTADERGEYEGDDDRPPVAAGRDALFVGLGDAVIPTILVASAVTFLDAPPIEVPLIALNLPALGAVVGTTTGLVVLLYMVLQGRPHAGLPLLNGGAIGGYLVGAVASGISVATALGL